MKYLKMLGLAALAAMALTAVMGAGTASATVLDKAAGVKMVAGEKIHAIHSATEEKLTLHAGFATITCSESTIEGEITNAGGSASTVIGKITTLSWAGCNCEVVSLKNAAGNYGSLEIHHITGTTNGTLTGSGSEVTVNCFGTDCIYGTTAGTHLGTVAGGTTATMTIAAKVPRISGGFLCANPAAWTGAYVVDKPDTLLVTAS